jgi:hypothetical protein
LVTATTGRIWLVVVVGLAGLLGAGAAGAGEPEDLSAAHDPEPPHRFGLGLYPGVSAVIGLPNPAAYQGSVAVSFMDRDRFSFFVAYGVERGPNTDSKLYTLGWGGVRPLQSGAPQRGFHGKFLRYRRWDDEQHGVHHGLSLGTETGVGCLSVTWELGASRSDRNHWMATGQVAVKIALPVYLGLGPRRSRVQSTSENMAAPQ